MKYKKSIVEAIKAERELGKTYREIAQKLKLTIREVKEAVIYDKAPKLKKDRK